MSWLIPEYCLIRSAILNEVQATLRYLVGKSLRQVLQVRDETPDSKHVDGAVEAVWKRP